MDGLRGYIFMLTVISITASVLIIIAPEKGGLNKYFRWITALCITAALLFPLSSSGGLDFFEDYKNNYRTEAEKYDYEATKRLIIDSAEQEIKNAISDMINRKFKTDISDCEVNVTYDDNTGIVLDFVTVKINTKSSFLLSDIEKYLKQELECGITVTGVNNEGVD